MHPLLHHQQLLTRRPFFGRAACLGSAALACLLAATARPRAPPKDGAGLPHFAPKAKRVIYLFQSGGPSQMDLFDYKPKMNDLRGKELPDSIRNGQRLTGMTAPGRAFPSRRRSSSLPTTARAGPGSANCCRTPRKSSTTSASSSRCTPRRSITIRPSRFSRPATSSPAGPASAPGSPTGWAARTRICRRSSS